MISAISSSPLYHPAEKGEAPSSSWWSHLKLKQISIGFFSLLALMSGFSFIFYSFTAAIIQPAFFAIPCFIAAGCAIWMIISATHNSAELESFRANIKQKPLLDIIKQHGAKKIFQYGIPLPEDFSKQYRETLRNMPLDEALGFCDVILKAYQEAGTPEGYKISSSSELREKWKAEKNKPPCILLEKYDLEKLEKHGVISQGMHPEYERLMAAKKELEPILTKFSSRLETIERNFDKNCLPFLTKLKQILENELKKPQDKEQLLMIEELLRSISTLTNPKNFLFHFVQTNFWGQSPSRIESFLSVQKNHSQQIKTILEDFYKEVFPLIKKREESLRKREARKKEKCNEINKKYPLS